MSAKRNLNDDEGEDYDFQDEEEDEEEEEDDFIPGAEDDDDDDDDDSDEEPLSLKGRLSLDEENKLHFKGDGFHLSSSEPVQWNLLDSTVEPESETYSLVLTGPCDLPNQDDDEDAAAAAAVRKATPRKIQVTWTVHRHPYGPAFPGYNGGTKTVGLKSSNGGSGDHDDDKKAPQAMVLFYLIHGRQIDCSPSDECLELRGGYHPLDGPKEVDFMPEVRIVAATPAAPVAAAAAAAARRNRNSDNDDDDDEIEDADDDVDFDEIIALNEESRLSVEALRKRYHAGGDDDGGGGGEASPTAKRGKSNRDEDDDDDIEF